MGQDLRELLRDSLQDSQFNELSENHELRFLDKLEDSFPKEKLLEEESKGVLSIYKNKQVYKKWGSIAASLMISAGLGVYFVNQTQELQQGNKGIVHINKQTLNVPSLADVSPEFKQIEDNYLTTINVGLSQLNVNDSNRGVVKSGMNQLNGLKEDYQSILKDLQYSNPTPQTIKVLIENLEMQLLLLKQLKQKVKNINEYSPNNAYQNLQT